MHPLLSSPGKLGKERPAQAFPPPRAGEGQGGGAACTLSPAFRGGQHMPSLIIGLIVVYAIFFALIHFIVTRKRQ